MPKFYKCAHCGNIVEMVDEKTCVPHCCGVKMDELVANTQENVATEKHIPVVEIEGNKVHVKVGEVEHPMLEAHFIEWIYLVTDQGVYRHRLIPGQKPETTFTINEDEDVIEVLEYCNLHGLWAKKFD